MVGKFNVSKSVDENNSEIFWRRAFSSPQKSILERREGNLVEYDDDDDEDDSLSSSEEQGKEKLDTSFQEIFTSVNSLLQSRQTFTLHEGTSLENELKLLKRMVRRRSLSSQISVTPTASSRIMAPKFVFDPPLVQEKSPRYHEKQSRHFCLQEKFPFRDKKILDDLSGSKDAAGQQTDEASMDLNTLKYEQQKEKLHGFLKDTLPVSLEDSVPYSPTKKKSANGWFSCSTDSDEIEIDPFSTCISPLSEEVSPLASPVAWSVSSGLSSISCSVASTSPQAYRSRKKGTGLHGAASSPTRLLLAAGMNMQRAFDQENHHGTDAAPRLPGRSDRAPRQPRRERSFDK